MSTQIVDLKSQANVKAIKSLLSIVILTSICILGFSSRLFAVIRFESIIHEFDPWFNFRATKRLTEHGFYEFLNWFDERAWYPLGRIVGGTVYPGLMLTAGLMHSLSNFLGFSVLIKDVCVFTAPLFSGLTALSTYLLTKELWSEGAGLFSAAFICIAPGYISRSVAGSYDNEGIAIFALQFTYFLWIKAMKSGSIMWATFCALSYFYMVSAWGGYVYIINIIPLHVFVLILIGRFNLRHYTAYTTFYTIGQLCAMNIPFVGFQPIRTSEHMASFGVFGFVQVIALFGYLKHNLGEQKMKRLFWIFSLLVFALGLAAIIFLTASGIVAPWSGRFYSLWDTGYARIHIPIISSVSEHQPTTWTSFFFDLHVLVAVFPAGLWLCVQEYDDARVFLIIYGVFSAYFAGVMVRLMLTLTPIVCILAAIVFSELFNRFVSSSPPPVESEQDESSPNPTEEEIAVANQLRSIVCILLVMILFMFGTHCTWVTSNAYSSPSVVLSTQNRDGTRNILDDFREAYYWLRTNTPDDARVMSWWDYGYQIAGMADRSTLVDNNTWNNTHIAMVGKAMASNEDQAYEIMQELNVDYVLVIFGGVIGYSGDDINKFLWMVRIAEGEHPDEIKESNYFTPQGEYKVDSTAPRTFTESLIYKASFYRFGEVDHGDINGPHGFDRTRNTEIGVKDIKLKHIEEAFTTENWLVRIYRVKSRKNSDARIVRSNKTKKFKSRKTETDSRGHLRNRISSRAGANTRQQPLWTL